MRHVISFLRKPDGRHSWSCACGENGLLLTPWDEARSMRQARRHIAPSILGSVPRIRLKGGRS